MKIVNRSRFAGLILLASVLNSCSCLPKKRAGSFSANQNLNNHASQLLDQSDIENNNSDDNHIDKKYEILRSGPPNSPSPVIGQTVKIHYSCWYSKNGEITNLIASSYDLHQPFSFKLGSNQAILAWNNMLPIMHIGDHYRFKIPSELAWGKIGKQKIILGDQDLICELELLDFY
jgi:FKBP-type peptidyl-prolyl cis-trans isomerase